MEAEVKKGSKGKKGSIMSGKALFTYDPTLFKDDEDAVDDDLYEDRVESEEEEGTT
jgi:hypothetical protein